MTSIKEQHCRVGCSRVARTVERLRFWQCVGAIWVSGGFEDGGLAGAFAGPRQQNGKPRLLNEITAI
jgi:hypothetical protein